MGDIYLLLDSKQAGPFTPEQVRQFLAEGKATPETLAWREGLAEWIPVARVLGPAVAASASIPPAPPVAPAPSAATAKKGLGGCAWTAIIVACAAVVGLPIFACLAGIALGPISLGIVKAKESAALQTSRAICLAMFQYANDNGGAYPDGKSSTEVFQKLIDGKYLADPGIFYIAMPGKVRATSNTLKPENVCFDVTSGVTASTPGPVPLVFLTGFKITYAPGASAILDPASATPFAGPGKGRGGIAVAYKNNSARFVEFDADQSIPEFIPNNFVAGTPGYRQLTP